MLSSKASSAPTPASRNAELYDEDAGAPLALHVGIMNKRTMAAIPGAVWLGAIAMAVAAGVALNHPRGFRDVSSSFPSNARITNEPRQPADVTAESPVLQIPPTVIVGDPRSSARGVAEMQGRPQVIIGPGIVTYPQESFAKSDGDRIRR